jgi:hypothetical protein
MKTHVSFESNVVVSNFLVFGLNFNFNYVKYIVTREKNFPIIQNKNVIKRVKKAKKNKNLV